MSSERCIPPPPAEPDAEAGCSLMIPNPSPYLHDEHVAVLARQIAQAFAARDAESFDRLLRELVEAARARSRSP